MIMWFQGSGVGHKNVCEATNIFLNDRHVTDMLQDSLLDKEAGKYDGRNTNHAVDKQVQEKEEDYGYLDLMI